MQRGDILALREAVESFAALVAANEDATVKVGSWVAKEVLAHLVFWHETYVYLVGTALQGESPVLYTGPFRVLNERAVAENAGQPIARLIGRFLSAQMELERLTALSEGREVRVRIKEGSMARTLPQLVAAVESHVRGHEESLGREIRRAARHHPAGSL